ncbi:MAG: beta-L-arabinofuranosidase domain-containing protein, partial [Thermomicrobiales bacterium]
MQGTTVQHDRFQRPAADAVQMRGLLGRRFAKSRDNRLLPHEDDFLLWPFQEHCPIGRDHPDRPHPEITKGDWQGEFMGTWIDSAVLTAWNTDDHELRAKVDRLVERWAATQERDGYLGTYDEKDRWESWDVWVQAHDLIGLLSYSAQSGNEAALLAARRVADRVLADFGPGKRLLHTGPHGGMASSAILEPMIWLYCATGDERYLAFGRWLVDENWEAPGGPAISRPLLAGDGVARTGNAKAAEMLICFTGMVELYRATGDEKYLAPVLIAWQDIVEHHLYITGSASTGEHFQANFALRNDGYLKLGETCVSMTWLYLNLSLGRLTGEARFWDMAEQTLYNHLLGAQSEDGRGWAYYLGLRDSKRYRWHTDPDCCPSRGARALAQ